MTMGEDRGEPRSEARDEGGEKAEEENIVRVGQDSYYYHAYRRLTTQPLEEIKLSLRQSKRVERALIHRQRMKVAAEPLFPPGSSHHRPTAASMVISRGTRNIRRRGEGKYSKCLSTRFGHDTGVPEVSKKKLMDAMRTIVLMNAMKRVPDRDDHVAATYTATESEQYQQHLQRQPTIEASAAKSASFKWRQLAGFPHLVNQQTGLTPAVALVAAAAAAAAKDAGENSSSGETNVIMDNQKILSFTLVTTIQRLLHKARVKHACTDEDQSVGRTPTRARRQRTTSSGGFLSMVDVEELLTATMTASLGGASGHGHGEERNGPATPLGWTGVLSSGGGRDNEFLNDCAGLMVEQEEIDESSSMRVMGLGAMEQVQLDLEVMREKAALSVPRNTSLRTRVAKTRINSILRALERGEAIRDLTPDSGVVGIGDPAEGGLAAGGVATVAAPGTVEEGDRESRNLSSASFWLSDDDVEAVITHVDMDHSGEVDAKEFQSVISAAKQGKIADARLADCVHRIDDMLRLRHLRIRDVFHMLDSDGSGKLSRGELAKGIRELSGYDRATVIQRRQALRKRKKDQKDNENRRRAEVASFLDSFDGLREDTLQDRQFFATDVTDEKAFHDLLRSLCEEDEDEDEDEEEEEENGDDGDDQSNCTDFDDEIDKNGKLDNNCNSSRGKGILPQTHPCLSRGQNSLKENVADVVDGENPESNSSQYQQLRRQRRRQRRKKKGRQKMPAIISIRAINEKLENIKRHLALRRETKATEASAKAAAGAANTRASAKIGTVASTLTSTSTRGVAAHQEGAGGDEAYTTIVGTEQLVVDDGDDGDGGDDGSGGGDGGGGGSVDDMGDTGDQQDPVEVPRGSSSGYGDEQNGGESGGVSSGNLGDAPPVLPTISNVDHVACGAGSCGLGDDRGVSAVSEVRLDVGPGIGGDDGEGSGDVMVDGVEVLEPLVMRICGGGNVEERVIGGSFTAPRGSATARGEFPHTPSSRGLPPAREFFLEQDGTHLSSGNVGNSNNTRTICMEDAINSTNMATNSNNTSGHNKRRWGGKGIGKNAHRQTRAAATATAVTSASVNLNYPIPADFTSKVLLEEHSTAPPASAVAVKVEVRNSILGERRGEGRRRRGGGRGGGREQETLLLLPAGGTGTVRKARGVVVAAAAARRATIKRAEYVRPIAGEDIVERQKKYALDDRYLRVYLQRRFESERLPLLFAERSSRSTTHRYTVTNPIEMAKKQAARIPPLV